MQFEIEHRQLGEKNRMAEAAQKLAVTALTTRVDASAVQDLGEFSGHIVQLMMTGAKFPGFWSGEIIPPGMAHDAEWKLIQRFSSPAEATAWQDSADRRKIIATLAAGTNGSTPRVSDEVVSNGDAEVATAIVTDVKPGMEEQYFAWEESIQKEQAKFPGYRGVYLQPPVQGREGQWSTLLRFATPAQLETWFASPKRNELLGEAKKFVTATHFKHVNSSFPGWFPVDETTGQPPPNWKTALLIVLGLFPVVMLEMKFLSPLLASLSLSLATFISLVGSVVATTWITTPLFIKWFSWWLFPKADAPKHTSWLGSGILCGLFALEVFVLSFVVHR